MFRLKSACCMSVESVDYTNSRYKSTTGQLFVILYNNSFMVWFTSCLSTNCLVTSSLPVIEEMVFQALRITHFRIRLSC